MIIVKPLSSACQGDRALNSILGNVRVEGTTECNGCPETSSFPPYPHSQKDLDQYKVKL